MMMSNTTTNTLTSAESTRVEKVSLNTSKSARAPLANITNAKKTVTEVSKLSSQFEKDCKISKKPKMEDGADEPAIAGVPHEEIDKNDFNDPQAVAEYVNPIYEYLMIREKDRVDFTYMINQKHITEKNASDFGRLARRSASYVQASPRDLVFICGDDR